jgi:hypothetical protein
LNYLSPQRTKPRRRTTIGPRYRPAGRAGKAFVDIKRDEIYAVKVHNGTKHEASITLRIDGIDVFHFSEVRDPKTKAPKYKHFIVQPGETVIPGWHKTNSRADSFLVTEYGKSAAAEEPNLSRGKIGVVTVNFALAWEGDKMPDEEKGTRDGGNATGFGPPLQVGQKEVERRTGVVRNVISVRYTR